MENLKMSNDELTTLEEIKEQYILVRKKTAAEWQKFVDDHKSEWIAAGNSVKALRESLKMSKAALAKEAGICVGTLRKLEQGKYIRRFKTIYKACRNALLKIYYRQNNEINNLIRE